MSHEMNEDYLTELVLLLARQRQQGDGLEYAAKLICGLHQRIAELTSPKPCEHKNTREQVKIRTSCRWLLSWDERYAEGETQETVELRDVEILCADCGEALDIIYAD